MNSKTIIKLVVFIMNILFTVILATFALWSGLPNFIYFFWLFIGMVSTIFFAFYFKEFLNWTEFMYRTLLHGCLIYSILWVVSFVYSLIQ
jgi:hypothetical protein